MLTNTRVLPARRLFECRTKQFLSVGGVCVLHVLFIRHAMTQKRYGKKQNQRLESISDCVFMKVVRSFVFYSLRNIVGNGNGWRTYRAYRKFLYDSKRITKIEKNKMQTELSAFSQLYKILFSSLTIYLIVKLHHSLKPCRCTRVSTVQMMKQLLVFFSYS